MKDPRRRLPIGAEPTAGGGVSFRVWAPRATTVSVLLGSGTRAPLERESRGYFSALLPNASVGDRYRLELDGGEAFPDPASRYQPEGPHGPSEIVDPAAFVWSDRSWPGIGAKGRVLYEMHVGTMTRAGTYAAAAERLEELADIGINTIEMMPVHEFPGRFGWGYDGVNLFAPTRLYGAPDDLRRFIDRAHALEIGVILDVVYNHFGPDGNYLSKYSRSYFTKRHENEWGDAIDFDGPESDPVRELFIENAGYWIDEFHFDGLRLDATQSIHDSGDPHVITEIVTRARGAAGRRSIYIVAENEPEDIGVVRRQGVDAMWNDDFHHSAVVALTGRNEAYFSDHRGDPQELISALKWGFLFQGQRYDWQSQPRGTPSLFEPAESYVLFLENHDQIANRELGRRLLASTSPGRWRAMSAVLLLAPSTPLLFQGQERGSRTPWQYFADHAGELGGAVRTGRADFLSQFPSKSDSSALAEVADPGASSTFESCVLGDPADEGNPAISQLYRELLRIRRRDAVFARQDKERMFGAVLGAEAFLLRYASIDGDDRLVLVNLGRDLRIQPAPEPLLAPPQNRAWKVVLSTEEPRFGGGGTPPIHDPDTGWFLPGHAAFVLEATRCAE